MKRRQFFPATLVILAAALHGCSTMESTSGLVSSLSKQVGVSSQQASAGVGSIFSYAKDRLSPTDFNTVAKTVPGVDSYMKAASEQLGPAKVADRAGLNSSLTRLGLSQDQINQFVPAVTDYVAKQGGDYAKNLLLGALR